MKRFAIIRFLVPRIFFLIVIFILSGLPSASADDTQRVPCGKWTDGSEAHYVIYVNSGIADGGGKCEGAIEFESKVKIIASKAFANSRITSVAIPNSVYEIGASAFQSARLLKLVSFGDSVRSLGEYAFFGTSLTTVDLPNSLTETGEDSFGNTPLEKVTLPNSIRIISRRSFASTQLREILIPNGVIQISGAAFSNSQLQSLTIPNSVVVIDNYAFSKNPITNLTLGNSVREIGLYAFNEALLKSVYIPDSVQQVSNGAFSGNKQLEYLRLSENLEIFEKQSELFSLKTLEYCGSKQFQVSSFNLPMVPTCPPERIAQIKAEAEAKAKAEAEAKAKAEAEAKAKAEAEAKAKASASTKKTTLTCVRGKITKKVTAKNPRCPQGYQKK